MGSCLEGEFGNCLIDIILYSIEITLYFKSTLILYDLFCDFDQFSFVIPCLAFQLLFQLSEEELDRIVHV
jgi:hypothetical protein